MDIEANFRKYDELAKEMDKVLYRTEDGRLGVVGGGLDRYKRLIWELSEVWMETHHEIKRLGKIFQEKGGESF